MALQKWDELSFIKLKMVIRDLEIMGFDEKDLKTLRLEHARLALKDMGPGREKNGRYKELKAFIDENNYAPAPEPTPKPRKKSWWDKLWGKNK